MKTSLIKEGSRSASHLKVLFITAWYPTPERPGAGIFVRAHARAVQIYDEVVVLHCQGPSAHLQRAWRVEREASAGLTAGIPTYRVQHRLSPLPKTSYGFYLLSVLAAYRQIRACGFRPDVVHANIHEIALPAWMLGRMLRVPVVITEHSSAFHTRSLTAGQIRLARLIFARADRVLPVSRFLQHAIERYSIRARFTVVPNVVDTSLFSPAAHSPARGEPKRLLFVGGLAGIKGLTYLLAALAQLRGQREDWRLDVVGDGPLRTEHERTTRELGLFDRIVFHGHRSPEEVAGLMREADFLVSPSLVETFSVVAAEALASGIPVLATRSGGPEEFVTEDVGLLVPTGDVNALCSGIVYMLDHAHNYSPERIAAYARARFSPEIVGATLHELYCSLQK